MTSRRFLKLWAVEQTPGGFKLWLAVWVPAIFGAAALAIALGWIAIDLSVKITSAFEVIAEIVGWILWPLLI